MQTIQRRYFAQHQHHEMNQHNERIPPSNPNKNAIQSKDLLALSELDQLGFQAKIPISKRQRLLTKSKDKVNKIQQKNQIFLVNDHENENSLIACEEIGGEVNKNVKKDSDFDKKSELLDDEKNRNKIPAVSHENAVSEYKIGIDQKFDLDLFGNGDWIGNDFRSGECGVELVPVVEKEVVKNSESLKWKKEMVRESEQNLSLEALPWVCDQTVLRESECDLIVGGDSNDFGFPMKRKQYSRKLVSGVDKGSNALNENAGLELIGNENKTGTNQLSEKLDGIENETNEESIENDTKNKTDKHLSEAIPDTDSILSRVVNLERILSKLKQDKLVQLEQRIQSLELQLKQIKN